MQDLEKYINLSADNVAMLENEKITVDEYVTSLCEVIRSVESTSNNDVK